GGGGGPPPPERGGGGPRSPRPPRRSPSEASRAGDGDATGVGAAGFCPRRPGARIGAVRPRDLETLEFPRVLDAIAERARSAAGRDAVRGLTPRTDATAIESDLAQLDEVRALAAEAGRAPTADVPRLGPVLAAAAPDGAALELRRLVELRDGGTVAAGGRAGVTRETGRGTEPAGRDRAARAGRR